MGEAKRRKASGGSGFDGEGEGYVHRADLDSPEALAIVGEAGAPVNVQEAGDGGGLDR